MTADELGELYLALDESVCELDFDVDCGTPCRAADAATKASIRLEPFRDRVREAYLKAIRNEAK